jgi:2-amino-4-hydroxy-6-hydroxymethyldihydropteridine diphosphokinase
MAQCLIGLGSNLGDRRATLERAVARLVERPRIARVAASRWRETSPAGGPPGQSAFLNGAATLETTLEPLELLAALQAVEGECGRVRAERWGPRTLDLDLLLYDRVVLEMPSLAVPHPRMAWRRFVLEPAAEIAPAMVHPTTGWTLAELWRHSQTSPFYLAFAGGIGAGKTCLAERLVRETPARMVPERLDLDRLAAFYADPTGRAWGMELEFLDQRTRLLAADAPHWATDSLVVSDFWFDQSPAFARVWLPPGRWEEYRRRWEAARAQVVRPRLLVLLDVAAETLYRRVRRRDRECERGLTVAQLDRIHKAVVAEAARPDQGPVFKIPNDDCDRTFREVIAAIEEIRG